MGNHSEQRLRRGWGVGGQGVAEGKDLGQGCRWDTGENLGERSHKHFRVRKAGRGVPFGLTGWTVRTLMARGEICREEET